MNFIILKSKKRQRETLVTVVGIFDKVGSGCIDFRNKNKPGLYYKMSNLVLAVLTSLSLGQYSKASVWNFTVKTSLSVNK